MQPAQIEPMSENQNRNPVSSPSTFSSPSAPSSFYVKFLNSLVVPKSIWLIGLAMGLINISFVVVFSLSPLYLKKVVGITAFWIVQLEHAVDALSYVMKLMSGVISDYFRRRKPLMLAGYFFTVISKPIIAIAASSLFVGISGQVLIVFARVFERIGNGIQSTPRDALVSDLAPAEHRARSLGLMRALGVGGSCLGGVLGFMGMHYTNDSFEQVFWIACLPAFMAMCILILFIKDPKTHVDSDGSAVKSQNTRRSIKFSDLKLLGMKYWLLMIVVLLFMMARFNESLIILYTNEFLNVKDTYAPLIISLYGLSYSLSSYYSGRVADRFGRKAVLIFGIGSLVVSDGFMFAGEDLLTVFIGIFIWGIQMGTVLNTFLSMITDYVPEDLRGTGIGMFHLISSIGALMAGAAAGFIVRDYGADFVFLGSLCVGVISLLMALKLLPSREKIFQS